MASLLIIGGSGFFGKSFLDAYERGLLNNWEISKVIIISRNAKKLLETNNNLINNSVELINEDITSCTKVPITDYVIHAAASADASNYLSKPLEEKLNIQAGANNYCRLAKKFHKNSKILFVSSGAVYGLQPINLRAIPETYSLEADVNHLSINKRDYAAAKRDSENAFIQLGIEGLNVSIARCFAFLGPYLPLDKHFAVGNFIGDGISGRDIKVLSRNATYRSYMYSDDLVQWLMRIMSYSNNSCPIFNVGSNKKISIIQLAYKISKIFKVNINYEYQINDTKDIYLPCTDKAERILGLKLSMNIDQALNEMIKRIQNG